MSSGRVDLRTMKRTGKTRLRFYNVYPDQLETVQTALRIARRESGTEHDTVALESICIHFLTTFSVPSEAQIDEQDV
jgi:hypothetical protein